MLYFPHTLTRISQVAYQRWDDLSSAPPFSLSEYVAPFFFSLSSPFPLPRELTYIVSPRREGVIFSLHGNTFLTFLSRNFPSASFKKTKDSLESFPSHEWLGRVRSICKTRATFPSPWKRINLGVESLLHYCLDVLFRGIIRVMYESRIFSLRENFRASCIDACRMFCSMANVLLIKLCVRSSCSFSSFFWNGNYSHTINSFFFLSSTCHYIWLIIDGCFIVKKMAYENLLNMFVVPSKSSLHFLM